jgi:hypothetical protein
LIGRLALMGCVLALGCAAQQATRTTATLFETPEAELARELAPDLYGLAEAARAKADAARGRREEGELDDYRQETELWLSAAVAEAERIQLERHRIELQREEERWAKQLARDQEASAVVATDISRYQAQRVALREAERVSSLGQSPTTDDATLDAVLTRVRLNLALAKSLGASEAQVRSLEKRADAMALNRPRSAKVAEALLLDTEELIGKMRTQWPEPRPGASTELVEMASLTGFAADRTSTGVIVRSERFFTSGGELSESTIQRFEGLLGAYPHGPVACQVAVPEVQSRVWARRVASLVNRLRRIDNPSRVSTSMVATSALGAGTVQCTFAAYRAP